MTIVKIRGKNKTRQASHNAVLNLEYLILLDCDCPHIRWFQIIGRIMYDEFGIYPMNVISICYGKRLIWGLLYYISIQVYINCTGKGKRTGPIWGEISTVFAIVYT